MYDCSIIILGATGDLAKRKLIPALYSLVGDKKFKKFIIVGAAMDDISGADMIENAKEFLPEPDNTIWPNLIDHSFYQKIDFASEDDFKKLHSFVSDLEKKHGISGNRLVYFAISPHFFCEVTKNCATSGLVKKLSKDDKTWNRIIYEKPFGWDLASAHEINKCIAKSFYEDQIFRVDHYLTKEIIGNIALVRFTNCVFEPIWDKKYIDQVSIILDEKVCLEGRGAYYDKFGALRDVVQNHMLELLSLIAMEPPDLLTGDYIRDKRVDVLKHVEFVDGILGQYEGYKKEEHIDPNSNTDTAASLLFMINNDRWRGVPFYLKTGKCLDKKTTEIQIKFKKIECKLLKGCPTDSNYLTINIYPKGTFYLTLNAKKPGIATEVMPVHMEFCHKCQFGTVTPESYEVIFQEVINGEQSISVRFDEIETLWKITDQLIAKKLPVYEYKKGSNGPEQEMAFKEKHGLKVK